MACRRASWQTASATWWGSSTTTSVGAAARGGGAAGPPPRGLSVWRGLLQGVVQPACYAALSTQTAGVLAQQVLGLTPLTVLQPTSEPTDQLTFTPPARSPLLLLAPPGLKKAASGNEGNREELLAGNAGAEGTEGAAQGQASGTDGEQSRWQRQ